MLLLPLLALAAAWSHGQAEVLLKQHQASVSRKENTTAWIDCTVEGVSSLQSATIHWYQHIPSKAPKRILYIRSGQVSYDDESYRSKYSLKQSAKVFTFSVNDINSNDEGTYYCAYW
ncbi:KV02 protein, partial [Ciconia maguari]|nr:KV02 protein [Ciconia maguari]